MNVLLFEDSQAEKLAPITTARPAFEITCACLRLIDHCKFIKNVCVSVRSYLREITLLNHDFLAKDLNSADEKTLVINARCVPCPENFDAIQKLLSGETPANPRFDSLGNVAIAVVDTQALVDAGLANNMKIAAAIKQCCPTLETEVDAPIPTLQLPHDVIKYNQQFFNDNLNRLIQSVGYSQTSDGVFVAENAKVSDQVAFDTFDGPILIDAGARIKPFAYLQGPVYIGPGCTVNEHSAIKDFVCLTNTIKAGGEIEACVIEPYSNKQHHGFLGHSYLGSWINLGAGTCNSDLKNTYGKVSAIYGDKKTATDMQFVGCFIGDYSKSAINASIYTGKSIGVASMMYGVVPTSVPAFVNYARIFNQITEIPVDVMVTTQKRMFARRAVEQRQCDIQLIHDMFELTAAQRQATGVQPGQLKF